MLFLHKDCGGSCNIDLSSIITIVGKPYVVHNKGALSTKNISITRRTKKVLDGKDVKFICDVCENYVIQEEIYSVCGYCKQTFPIEDLFGNEECGELLCKICDEKYFDTRTAITLEELIKKIILN